LLEQQIGGLIIAPCFQRGLAALLRRWNRQLRSCRRSRPTPRAELLDLGMQPTRAFLWADLWHWMQWNDAVGVRHR